ncbi:MAG: hypothetical protein AB8I08_29105 [Sandaracinaceae bacterium]
MRLRAVSLALTLLAACDGTPEPLDAGPDASADAGPVTWPAAEVPAETEPEPGILRALLTVDGFAPPANPSTSDSTPAEFNRTQVVRFYGAEEPDVRAVIVAMPGIFGGAGTFEQLARHLVRISLAAGEPVEVWAIDRRSNLLEDLRGVDAAEAMENADVARGYYFRGETVGGEAFAGYRPQADVPFMSEWGVETHVEDLRAVIERVPEAQRQAHVVLMGHSLGASLTETFAAWRFPDGVRGAELLAGIVLIDGAARTEAIDETQFMEGESGIMGTPGVDTIRSGTRYLAIPLLGLDVYPQAEITSMDALYAPSEVVDDRDRDMFLSTLMSLSVRAVPPMTNQAAFGWAFDDASNGLSFAAVSLGEPTGGPVESYDSLFGATLQRPSDPDATYDWVDAPDTSPAEETPLANLAHSWIDGRTNFAEWYFPARLSLDLSAVGGLAVPEDGWQADAGLRAFDGALVDAPVLAVAAALAPPERYDAMRDRIAAVGEGRPNAGATRDTEAGFRVVDATDQTHLDPLTGSASGDGSVPAAILEFTMANVQAGTVASPL